MLEDGSASEHRLQLAVLGDAIHAFHESNVREAKPKLSKWKVERNSKLRSSMA